MITTRDEKNSTVSVFAEAKDLLLSVLKHWVTYRTPGALAGAPCEAPAGDDGSSTHQRYGYFNNDARTYSLLLCGPSGNGKSTLVEGVVAEFALQCPHTPLLIAAPRLARAVAMRNTQDAHHTLLRREIRASVSDAVRRRTAVRNADGGEAEEKPNSVLLIVLDHLEFFLSHTGGRFAPTAGSNGDGGDAATAGDEDEPEEDGFAFTHHPEFISDYYSVVRDSPPLFTAEELHLMGIKRVVVVSLASVAEHEMHPFCVAQCYDRVFTLSSPNEQERLSFFLETLAGSAHDSADEVVTALCTALAYRSGGITYAGLVEVAELAAEMQREPGGPLATNLSHSDVAAVATTAARSVIALFRNSGTISSEYYCSAGGYIDVQHTPFDAIAGMESVKTLIQERMVRLPRQFKHYYTRHHVRPAMGILFYGPPGTGKTLLAKAMATSLNASFIYINLPELLQSEVGESERKLTEFFQLAKEKSPSVIFMDEIQSGFGNRYSTAGGDSAHDSRLVSHLLHLLDVTHAESDSARILFVGATNVIEQLDPLLLRPGRLDVHVRVPLPDRAARAAMATHCVRGTWAHWFASPTSVNSKNESLQSALIDAFVEASEGYSGAELVNSMNVLGINLLQSLITSSEKEHAAESTLQTRPIDEEAEAVIDFEQFRSALAALLCDGVYDDGRVLLSETAESMIKSAFSVTTKQQQYTTDSF